MTSKVKNFFNTEKNSWQLLLLASAVPIFLAFLPILLGFYIFSDNDALSWSFPFWSFYQKAIQSNDSFLWNPYNFSGFPSFITITGGYLSPINYLACKFIPYILAYHWLTFIYLVLAAFFTALLLKKFNIGFWGCWLGGLAFILSQWVWIPGIPIVFSMAFLPLFFLLIWELKNKKKWPIAIGSLLIGWAWLSAHYNWQAMIFFASFLWAIYLSLFEISELKNKINFWLKFILMIGLGTLIGLIQLIPLLAYVPLSARSAGLTYEQAARGFIGVGEIVALFLPDFQLPFIGSTQQLYFGVLPFFFFLIAFTVKSKVNRFFLFLFAFCFLTAVPYSPTFWFLQKLPVLKYFQAPYRWMFIGGFAVAVLSGFGWQKFISLVKSGWQKFIINLFKFVTLSILIFSLIINFILFFWRQQILSLLNTFFDNNLYEKTSKLPLEHYHQVIEDLFSQVSNLVSFSNLKFILAVFFLILSYQLISRYYLSNLSLHNFKLYASLIIVLNFSIFLYLLLPIMPIKTFNYQSKTAEFLQDKPGKILSILSGYTEFTKLVTPHQSDINDSFLLRSEMIATNYNLYYEIESADYYDNLMSAKMAKLLSLIGSERSTAGEKLSRLDILPEEKIKIFERRKNLLDLLGIKYIISSFSLDEQKFFKVFETTVPPYGIKINIYENPQAAPLFYLAKDFYLTSRADDEIIQDIVNQSQDSNVVYVQWPVDNTKISLSGQGAIELKKRTNNQLDFEVETESKQLLVISQNNLPGWQAYINNVAVPIYTVNTVYQGVFIPAGKNNLILKFKYPFPNKFRTVLR